MDGIFDQSKQIWTKSHDKVLKTLLVPFPKVISVPNYQEQTFFLIDQHCHHWKESNRLELLDGCEATFLFAGKSAGAVIQLPNSSAHFDFVKSDYLIGSLPLVPGDEFQHCELRECLIDPIPVIFIDFDWQQSIQ